MTTRTGPEIGVTLYSFTNEWLTRQFDLPGLLREVATRQLGPNIEVIGFQNFKEFPDVSDRFAAEFRAMVAEQGLNPVSCAINSDRFLKPGQQPIDDASLVEYHRRQLVSAKKCGFELVRFQFALPAHLLPQVAEHAEAIDIRMGVEVHAPMWSGHPAVQEYAEQYDRIGSARMGWIPDFSGTASRIPPSMLEAARKAGAAEGLLAMLHDFWLADGPGYVRAASFREKALAEGHAPAHIQAASLAFFILANNDPKSWAALVDRTIHIHGKFYGVSDDLREEAIDYDTILPLFRDGGFTGTLVSEWEGHAYDTRDAFEQVRRHQAMCRRILAG